MADVGGELMRLFVCGCLTRQAYGLLIWIWGYFNDFCASFSMFLFSMFGSFSFRFIQCSLWIYLLVKNHSHVRLRVLYGEARGGVGWDWNGSL